MASLLNFVLCLTTLLTCSLAQTCRQVPFNDSPCKDSAVFKCYLSEKDAAIDYCNAVLASADTAALTSYVTVTEVQTSTISAEATSTSTLDDTTTIETTATPIETDTDYATILETTSSTVISTITSKTRITITNTITATASTSLSTDIAKRSVSGAANIGCLQTVAPSDDDAIFFACSCLIPSATPIAAAAATTTITTTLTSTIFVSSLSYVDAITTTSMHTIYETVIEEAVTTTTTVTVHHISTVVGTTQTTLTLVGTRTSTTTEIAATVLAAQNPNIRIEGRDWSIYEGYVISNLSKIPKVGPCDGNPPTQLVQRLPHENFGTRLLSAAQQVGQIVVASAVDAQSYLFWPVQIGQEINNDTAGLGWQVMQAGRSTVVLLFSF